MSILLPNAYQQFCDGNGVPLAGGFVYTYQVGTTTFAETYQDYLLTIPNNNPIVLDGNGRCQIWGVGAFQQVVTDQYGNQVFSGITSDGSINPANLFAPISGSAYYAPASGSPNYAPISGSAFYAAIGGSAAQGFQVAEGTLAQSAAPIEQVQKGLISFSYDTGTINTIVATLDPAISDQYWSGQEVRVAIANTNTGPATLNVNGIGASPIILGSGSALSGGELKAGIIAVFVWNLTYNSWQLVNSNANAHIPAWQNLTSSRSLATNYTNNFSYSIDVAVVCSFSGTGQNVQLIATVAGAVILTQTYYTNGTGALFSIYFSVPPGATYSLAEVVGSPATFVGLTSWSELS